MNEYKISIIMNVILQIEVFDKFLILTQELENNESKLQSVILKNFIV